MKTWLLRVAYALREAWTRAYGPRTIGVRALVVDDEGRVLLVRHTYGPRRWHLPGGGIRRRESLVDAIRRELSEEVGIEPTGRPRLLGTYSNLRRGRSDHVSVFVVREWREQTRSSAEIAERRWCLPGELPEGVSPATARRIAEWQRGGPDDLAW